MKNVFKILLFFISSVLLISCSEEEEISNPDFLGKGFYEGDYYPTTEWRQCTPEEVGMNSEKLKLVYDYCASDIRKTDAFIVIKDGYIVAEAYFNKNNKKSKLPSYSLAKAFVAALTGIAIKNGELPGVEERIYNYFPQWQGDSIDPSKKEITIRQLLTMTSGLQWNEDEISFSGNNDIMNLRTLSTNFYGYVLNKPIVATPGTIWNYSSGMPILLAGILEKATDRLVFDYAKENLLNHLGITDLDWANDPEGHTIGAYGILTSARSYAKLGYLYYKNGIWDGTQILPENWVSETRVAPLPEYPKFGYMFWTAHRYPNDIGTRIPEDSYMAVGLFQKYIIIIPSQKLLLVRIGNDYSTGVMGWDTAEFISLVVNAIQ